MLKLPDSVYSALCKLKAVRLNYMTQIIDGLSEELTGLQLDGSPALYST